MARSFPEDRFDTVPDDVSRVGAHRAPLPRWHWLIWVGWCALAVAVLVGAGIVAFSVIDGNVNFTGKIPFTSSQTAATPTPTPTPTITPVVDDKLDITVLNGTNETGLAASVAEALESDGWKKPAVANASETDITTTTVYYSEDEDHAAALGVAKSLSDAKVTQTDAYAASGSQITVVVGSDFHQ